MMIDPNENQERFYPNPDVRLGELMLYVADRCSRMERFGAVKLNKILFFADFMSYAHRGRPVTGAAYFRLKNGPAPRRLFPVRARLVESRRAHLRNVPVGTKTEQRLVALESPDLSHFSGEDIAIVDEIIGRCWDDTATRLSVLSHEFPGWELAKDRETIPYYSALIDLEPPDLNDNDLQQASLR